MANMANKKKKFMNIKITVMLIFLKLDSENELFRLQSNVIIMFC